MKLTNIATNKPMRFRSNSGSQIAEFGPAMFLLLILGFFPFLMILQLAFGYVGCWYLNCQQSDLAAQSLRVRSGTFVNQSSVQTDLDKLALDWPQTPLGKLSKVKTSTATISGPVDSGSSTSGYTTAYVQTTTTVQCSPLISIPFLNTVPGLGAPINYTISAQRIVEDATQ